MESFTDAEFPLNHAEKGVFQYQLVTDLKEDTVIAGGNTYNSVAESAYVLLPQKAEAKIQENPKIWKEITE